MVETDKIVAAILTAAAYSKQEAVSQATLAGDYREFLELVRAEYAPSKHIAGDAA